MRGIFKERPHNSHPCEFARNGFIQEVEFTRNSICKERSLQGTELARNGGKICKEWLCNCKEQSHGTSPAMWDHTVLPATRRK